MSAAVFILLGQSNAVSRGLPMPAEAQFHTPLSNVFGLSRAYNQSFDITALHWSGYTSDGMNLGQTCDDTYTVANCLARTWQDAIDAGISLPDLYIVHAAIGAQGVTEQYMWYPDRPITLTPGVLGVADISLAPFTNHILSLLREDFSARREKPDFIGIHWRGGEQEDVVDIEKLKGCLYPTYDRLFADMFAALGQKVPVILHRLVYKDWCIEQDMPEQYAERVAYINTVFELLAQQDCAFSVFDARQAPFYNPKEKGTDLFLEDLIHYNQKTNQWVASEIIRQYRENRG